MLNNGAEHDTKHITNESKEKRFDEEFGAEYFGMRFKTKIVWANVLIFAILHAFALYATYLMFTLQCKAATVIFALAVGHVSGILGITGGAHRLFSHRSFKAKWPYRFISVLFNTVALQNHIYEWARDHRVHHKYSDTDADPHNTNRGLFFSHMGWLMMKKHPDVIRKGKTIDLSDLEQDPFVMFQKRYYKPLALLFAYAIPTAIPILIWNEAFWTSFSVASAWRHVILLHSTWSVNSIAHFWGYKPYDKSIRPSENLLVSFLAEGEGYHNYHHTFPHDYSTSEYRFGINITTAIIDLMAFFGLVYGRKRAQQHTVLNRRTRTGDLKNE